MVPVVAAAFRYLRNQKNEFEFLPPKVSKLQQLVSRLSSSRNLVLGGSAAAILLFCCGALLIQHVKLSNLQAEWNAIEAKVAEVEALQQKVKLFRPGSMTGVQSAGNSNLTYPFRKRVRCG